MPIKIVARVEDNGLLRRLNRASDGIKRLAARDVRKVSLAVEKRVKIDMPVDTGRARASWGHWTPGDVVRPDEKNRATRDDAYWLITDGGLTIQQGSNVVYIAPLNEGHSQQAPAGFIDKAAAAGARELEVELARTVDGVM